jgi:hypothetical protein
LKILKAVMMRVEALPKTMARRQFPGLARRKTCQRRSSTGFEADWTKKSLEAHRQSRRKQRKRKSYHKPVWCG